MSIFLRRSALAVGALIVLGMAAIFAPTSVAETVVGTAMIIAIAGVGIREQRHMAAETEAVLREAKAVHHRAEVLLGRAPRKRIWPSA